MTRYPYKSKFPYRAKDAVEGLDYWVWCDDGFDLITALGDTKGDFLELAGPTLTGYFFLDDMQLPQPVVITNISDNPYHDEAMNKRAQKKIVRHVDAQQLSYAAESLGLVLVHFLPYGKKPHSDKNWLRGLKEMSEIYLGLRRINETQYAQRILMLQEAYRALEPGGILITDGQLAELELMKRVGFIPRAMYIEHLSMEEVVLQKPNTFKD